MVEENMILPDNWEMKTVGEAIVCDFGDRITQSENRGTLYPVYGGGDKSFMTDSFNRSNEWVIGRFAISPTCVRFVKNDFWLMDSGLTFHTANDEIDQDYAGYYMCYIQPLIYNATTQTAQKNLDQVRFERLPFVLPPLPEQLRIAAVLSDLDDYIEKQEKLIEKNKKFRDGVLEELIPVYIESTTNDNQYQQVSKIVRTNVPPYKIPKTEYEQSGDFPIIDQGQIFISGYTNDVSQCFNDGCYILFGDHTCVLKYIEHAFAQGADGLKVLSSVDEQNYLPKYIYYAMNTVDIPPSYDRHWGTMSDAKVFVPPFPEQQRIASIMSDLDDNIAKQQTKLDKARKLKDALLNDLISGKIRLTDDE